MNTIFCTLHRCLVGPRRENLPPKQAPSSFERKQTRMLGSSYFILRNIVHEKHCQAFVNVFLMTTRSGLAAAEEGFQERKMKVIMQRNNFRSPPPQVVLSDSDDMGKREYVSEDSSDGGVPLKRVKTEDSLKRTKDEETDRAQAKRSKIKYEEIPHGKRPKIEENDTAQTKRTKAEDNDPRKNPYLAHMYEEEADEETGHDNGYINGYANGFLSKTKSGASLGKGPLLSKLPRHGTTSAMAKQAEDGPNNPYNGEPLSKKYFNILKTRRDLPVHAQRYVAARRLKALWC